MLPAFSVKMWSTSVNAPSTFVNPDSFSFVLHSLPTWYFCKGLEREFRYFSAQLELKFRDQDRALRVALRRHTIARAGRYAPRLGRPDCGRQAAASCK